jgi:hypothetical protein
MYLESCENTTLRFKTRIREGIASINDATTFDQFLSQIKRTVEHTPLMSSISGRFICDTFGQVETLWKSCLIFFCISMSANPRRDDLEYLFTSIDAILPSSTSFTLPSVAKTNAGRRCACGFQRRPFFMEWRQGGVRDRRQGNRGGRPGNPDWQKSNNR